MWYVLQVKKGREEAMVSYIKHMVKPPVLEECFCPKYVTEMKAHGQFVLCERRLFPGYIIAVTDDPLRLEAALSGLQEFAHVLSFGNRYIPLTNEEVDLISGFTDGDNHVVPMSMGVKNGDLVTVLSGPLVGHEAMIESIDRRKSVATITMSLCGRKVSVRMGLGILNPTSCIAMDMCEHE